MSKFIKVHATQCHENGESLFPGSPPANITISVELIKMFSAEGRLCLDSEIFYCPNSKNHFKNLRLINYDDLNDLIINSEA